MAVTTYIDHYTKNTQQSAFSTVGALASKQIQLSITGRNFWSTSWHLSDYLGVLSKHRLWIVGQNPKVFSLKFKNFFSHHVSRYCC